MSFLHPAVLAGLLAVALPVAIHLIHRFQVQRVSWAAMRFLHASVQRTRSRRRWEDLVLLLLRCLLVAALITAFARPVLKSLVAGGTGDGPSAVVILLDNSASMGQSDGVQTRFEQGKKEIGAWLDALPANSRVAFYTVSNVADPLVGKPSPDPALVRRALQLAQPGDRGSNLAPGFRAAFQTLKATPGGPREIRVYTDGQTAAWSGLEEIRKLAADNPGVVITPVVLGKHGEDNLGLTALEPEGGISAVNQPIRFRAQVANFGASPAENVRVTLAADTDAASDQKLIPRIDSGATQSADLFVRFKLPGPHSVTAGIPEDRFTADNTRSVAVQAVNRLGALILEGNAAGPLTDRDGYFLANALVPMSREQAADNYLKVTTQPFAGFKPAALASYGFVFLSDPGAVPPDLAAALGNYVTGGGNLVIFPGPQTDPARWQQTPAFWDLLPAVVLTRHDLAPEGKTLAWQGNNFRHPVTTLWNDPGQGSLASVRATEYFPLQLKPAAGKRGPAAALVNYADGQPAAAESVYGRGHVVLFSSTATPQWNNLPLHPAFVPVLQRLLGYLNRQNGTRLVFSPGEGFIAPVPIEYLGADFSVVRPGKDNGKHVAGKVELDGERAVIRYADTTTAGVYRVYLRQQDTPAAVFAVQVDPAESDLRQTDAKEIAALSAAPPAEGSGASAGATHAVVTREYWTLLLWVAAAAAAAEAVLAHRFSHAR